MQTNNLSRLVMFSHVNIIYFLTNRKNLLTAENLVKFTLILNKIGEFIERTKRKKGKKKDNPTPKIDQQ